MATLLSIHRGPIAPFPNGLRRSAIVKAAVTGPVTLSEAGIEGDQVADRRYHGGPFKAVCCCASEYYPDWAELAGREMPAGSFGENFFLQGLPDEEVCLGDVYTIGPVTIQVAGPRGPCKTLATHWGEKDFAQEVKRRRRTGWYARVLTGGTLSAPAGIILQQRIEPEWTLPKFWDLLDKATSTSREQLDKFIAAPWIDPDWLGRLKKLTPQ